MALSITLRGVRRLADGRIVAEFSDNQGLEFRDAAHFKQVLQDIDGQRDTIRLLMLLWCYRHDPTASNLPQFDGKTVTIDPLNAAGNLVTIG